MLYQIYNPALFSYMYIHVFVHIYASSSILCVLQAPAVVSPHMRPHPEDQHKIDEVLTQFCRICVSAVLESPDIPVSSLYFILQFAVYIGYFDLA